MTDKFLQDTSVIEYSPDYYNRYCPTTLDDIKLNNDNPHIRWYNTYGIRHYDEYAKIIHQNNVDDFLLKLAEDSQQANKLLELEDLVFIAIRILRFDGREIDSEQMFFLSSITYLWSIQEQPGDYFSWIRERIKENQGIVRKKNADYLLFLILESVIDNYWSILEKLTTITSSTSYTDIKPTPEFTTETEHHRGLLFELKKATIGLRDLLIKFDKIELEPFEEKYFTELREQANNLLSEIDFEMHEVDSKINLIFSVQGYRLNEVMMTLTILTVIFLPLTFIAGIYGMNFQNMPELQTRYGYFVVLAVMVMIAGIALWFFYRRQWLK